ncbi:hypothetical protein WJ0W_007130 [Paenibacillus melissococcoides]|uniref:DOD-type homing endonuclease domain-containing protein n=1 Tax=Paenibacillus melissococcoides TaxID=2912268 RepID=A0ABM9G8W3_9BACL|nr:hypothetical protein [Paenibacillus melissococcoides]CAH8248462.1 hypothetical protein WJ0W_007130 [Paenibacillus melissococcoides]CAH8722035.1 hypothetical protein HTL2_006660 [Paenibacillus melissococcoides]CAH8722146.1 hypothetical protein WDD9_006649 [Paenibacillus melissococcoides]
MKTLRDTWFNGLFCYHEFRSSVQINSYFERLGFNGLGYVRNNPFATSFMSIASYSSPAGSYDERTSKLAEGERVRIPWMIEFEKNHDTRLIEAFEVHEYLCGFGIDPKDIIIWVTPAGSIYMAVNPNIYSCVGAADQLCRRNQNITRHLVKKLDLKSIDMAHYSPQRVIRTFNSRHSSGYVVPITYNQLGHVLHNVKGLTRKPVDLQRFWMPCIEAPEWTSFVWACDSESIVADKEKEEFKLARRSCVDYFMANPEKIHVGIRNQVLVSMGIAAQASSDYSSEDVASAASRFQGRMNRKEIERPLRSIERRETLFSCQKVCSYLAQSDIDVESLCSACPFKRQMEDIAEAKEKVTDFMVYADHIGILFEQKWPLQDIMTYFEMSLAGVFRGKQSLQTLPRSTKQKYTRILSLLGLSTNEDGYIIFDRKRGYKVPLVFLHVAKRMGGVRLRQFLKLLSKSYRTAKSGYLTRMGKEGIQKTLKLGERAYYYVLAHFRELGMITRFSCTWKLTFGVAKITKFEKRKKLQSKLTQRAPKKMTIDAVASGFLEVAASFWAPPISISNLGGSRGGGDPG